MNAPADILVVDDQEDIRLLIQDILRDDGYATRAAADSAAALSQVATQKPDLVILDIWLEGSEMDGLEILRALTKSHPDLPVIIISGHGTIETAVSAIQMGAYDFIEKPFKADKLLVLAARALESARLKRENESLRRQVSGKPSELFGQSQAMVQARQAIERVAPTNSRVLITGEQGVGKDIAARMIHALSRRASGNYVSLNCAVLSPERMELELFGAEGQGQGRVQGVLERASGGTLFLDEVADMSPETQAKVVRALQDQSFSRLGGTEKIQVDVRVIASSNQDLQALMRQGRFREDLYYRLSVVPISIPPLRERLDDIPGLAAHLMDQAAQAAGAPRRVFSSDATALMQSYEWPGNVRQLKNVIEWLLIMAPGGEADPVTADMLPPDLKQRAVEMIRGNDVVELMSKPLREAREIFEREYLLSQVNRFGGNISKTALFIGMERSALHRKLKSLGVAGSDKGGLDDKELAEG